MNAELGAYVHVPFCRERCDYCAFATYTDRDHLVERYVEAVMAEIAGAKETGAQATGAQATGADEGGAEEAPLTAATSVFFGGGTPSRLDPGLLCRVLAALPRAEGAEVTVECNPEDAQVERLSAYRDAGVNRLSFGIQSTEAQVLASLGRRWVADAAARATAAAASAGFSTFNLDLIFGSPAETDASWEATLHHLLDLPNPPPHVSAYALTVEPGTPLAADPARHPDDDAVARRYELADRILSAAGYRWEEISNWALPGHQCRHNQLYWRQGDYLGFGSAAHSHVQGRRWWNVRTPERYIEAVLGGRSPVAGEERLNADHRRMEGLMLSLRTPAGVPAEALPASADLVSLVHRAGGRATLTVRGRLLANAVTGYLA